MVLNNATGYWDLVDYGSTITYNAGKKDDEEISEKDKLILRNLAIRVAEIATHSRQKEVRNLWFKHNSLQATRPLIIFDPENGWNEIITTDQLECCSRLSRHWEMVLKKEIFWGEKICDDRPIEPYFNLGYTFTESSWGLESKFVGGRNGGSYTWEPALKKYSDISKLNYSEIEVDYDITNKTYMLAKDIFGDILKVRLMGLWWFSFGLTYDLAVLRGMQQMMVDMIENPKFIHEVMQILCNGTLEKIKFLESNNLLSVNNDLYNYPGGFGYTSELPAKDFTGRIRPMDMWAWAESQETVGISPEMFEEFVFPYQLSILKLFGLNNYGCCEPLDNRFNIVKNIPRLRKVTVSPWANLEKMIDMIGENYCLCIKPHPVDLAAPKIDKEVIRKKMKTIFKKTGNCHVEVLMQDTHTIGNNPDNVIDWVKIAKEEAERII